MPPLIRPQVVPADDPLTAASASSAGLFSQYDLDRAYDEMFETPAHARPHYQALLDELATVSLDDLRRRQVEADRAFLTQGITFTVYGDAQGTERIFPFDQIGRAHV